MQSGVGLTGTNRILACLNVKPLTTTLFQRYQAKVGAAVEKCAKDSCKRAAQEERRLVIEEMDNVSSTM